MSDGMVVLHAASSTLIGAAVEVVLQGEPGITRVPVSLAHGVDYVLQEYQRTRPDLVVFADTGDHDRFDSVVRTLRECDRGLRVALITCAPTTRQLDLLLELDAAAVISPSDTPSAFKAAIWSLNYGSSWFNSGATERLHDGRNRVSDERRHENCLQALTRRERQILTLVASGLSNRQISAEVFVSERTVRFHTRNLFDKLGFETRGQAIVWVFGRDVVADRPELGTGALGGKRLQEAS